MKKSRREFVAWLGLLGITPSVLGAASMSEAAKYGLIGKIVAVAGKREELATVLIEGVSGMPGCLSYIVANDTVDADAIWVTEVWENQSMHTQSLQLESVQAAIAMGRPLIAAFGERFETEPLGGTGIELSI